jgi:hypothetical protein
VIIFIIILEGCGMVQKLLSMNLGSSHTSVLIRLEEFLDKMEIKTLAEINALNMEGKFIVLASIDSLVEGVDMWYKGDVLGEVPRYFINPLICYVCWFRCCDYFGYTILIVFKESGWKLDVNFFSSCFGLTMLSFF